MNFRLALFISVPPETVCHKHSLPCVSPSRLLQELTVILWPGTRCRVSCAPALETIGSFHRTPPRIRGLRLKCVVKAGLGLNLDSKEGNHFVERLCRNSRWRVVPA